jgi:dienelactone hydrolase
MMERLRERPLAACEAVLRTLAFGLTMSPPGLHTWLVRHLTPSPTVGRFRFPTPGGPMEMEVYRPGKPGRHAAVVVCLGVLPVGVTDPRVAMVGEAFARAGLAALLYWSPSMRELRLDPADTDRLVAAFQALRHAPDVDAGRIGMFGVCVGGSLALVASARAEIRDGVRFVAAHAPYSSLRTLALEIARESRRLDGAGEPWAVDPLTWLAYVRCVTQWLNPADVATLRDAFESRITWNATGTTIVTRSVTPPGADALSPEGRLVLRLLIATGEDAKAALSALPARIAAMLDEMSPLTCVAEVTSPVILLLHDREDNVVPVTESRRLWAVIRKRPGAHYTELDLNHLRIPRGWSVAQIAREMVKGVAAWYPVFRAVSARPTARGGSRDGHRPVGSARRDARRSGARNLPVGHLHVPRHPLRPAAVRARPIPRAPAA